MRRCQNRLEDELQKLKRKQVFKAEQGTAEFELLPHFSKDLLHDSQRIDKFGKACELLTSTFSKNKDQIKQSVYRGRNRKDGSISRPDPNLEAWLLAGIWLNDEVVCAALLRLNLPNLPPSNGRFKKHVQTVFQATVGRYQKHGLGRLLTRCILRAAAEEGHEYATVVVMDNEVKGYWEKMGFASVTTKDAYDANMVVQASKQHAPKSATWLTRLAPPQLQEGGGAAAVGQYFNDLVAEAVEKMRLRFQQEPAAGQDAGQGGGGGPHGSSSPGLPAVGARPESQARAVSAAAASAGSGAAAPSKPASSDSQPPAVRSTGSVNDATDAAPSANSAKQAAARAGSMLVYVIEADDPDDDEDGDAVDDVVLASRLATIACGQERPPHARGDSATPAKPGGRAKRRRDAEPQEAGPEGAGGDGGSQKKARKAASKAPLPAGWPPCGGQAASAVLEADGAVQAGSKAAAAGCAHAMHSVKRPTAQPQDPAAAPSPQQAAPCKRGKCGKLASAGAAETGPPAGPPRKRGRPRKTVPAVPGNDQGGSGAAGSGVQEAPGAAAAVPGPSRHDPPGPKGEGKDDGKAAAQSQAPARIPAPQPLSQMPATFASAWKAEADILEAHARAIMLCVYRQLSIAQAARTAAAAAAAGGALCSQCSAGAVHQDAAGAALSCSCSRGLTAAAAAAALETLQREWKQEDAAHAKVGGSPDLLLGLRAAMLRIAETAAPTATSGREAVPEAARQPVPPQAPAAPCGHAGAALAGPLPANAAASIHVPSGPVATAVPGTNGEGACVVSVQPGSGPPACGGAADRHRGEGGGDRPAAAEPPPHVGATAVADASGQIVGNSDDPMEGATAGAAGAAAALAGPAAPMSPGPSATAEARDRPLSPGTSRRSRGREAVPRWGPLPGGPLSEALAERASGPGSGADAVVTGSQPSVPATDGAGSSGSGSEGRVAGGSGERGNGRTCDGGSSNSDRATSGPARPAAGSAKLDPKHDIAKKLISAAKAAAAKIRPSEGRNRKLLWLPPAHRDGLGPRQRPSRSIAKGLDAPAVMRPECDAREPRHNWDGDVARRPGISPGRCHEAQRHVAGAPDRSMARRSASPDRRRRSASPSVRRGGRSVSPSRHGSRHGSRSRNSSPRRRSLSPAKRRARPSRSPTLGRTSASPPSRRARRSPSRGRRHAGAVGLQGLGGRQQDAREPWRGYSQPLEQGRVSTVGTSAPTAPWSPRWIGAPTSAGVSAAIGTGATGDAAAASRALASRAFGGVRESYASRALSGGRGDGGEAGQLPPAGDRAPCGALQPQQQHPQGAAEQEQQHVWLGPEHPPPREPQQLRHSGAAVKQEQRAQQFGRWPQLRQQVPLTMKPSQQQPREREPQQLQQAWQVSGGKRQRNQAGPELSQPEAPIPACGHGRGGPPAKPRLRDSWDLGREPILAPQESPLRRDVSGDGPWQPPPPGLSPRRGSSALRSAAVPAFAAGPRRLGGEWDSSGGDPPPPQQPPREQQQPWRQVPMQQQPAQHRVPPQHHRQWQGRGRGQALPRMPRDGLHDGTRLPTWRPAAAPSAMVEPQESAPPTWPAAAWQQPGGPLLDPAAVMNPFVTGSMVIPNPMSFHM